MDDLIAFLNARLDERLERIQLLPHWYYMEARYGMADVEAKRRIIERLEVLTISARKQGGDALHAAKESYRWVAKQLALPFSGHPDFREEWRTA